MLALSIWLDYRVTLWLDLHISSYKPILTSPFHFSINIIYISFTFAFKVKFKNLFFFPRVLRQFLVIMATLKSALLFCGDYMEDYEVMVPFCALKAFGVGVDCVSPNKQSGHKCITVVHDLMGYEVIFNNFIFTKL